MLSLFYFSTFYPLKVDRDLVRESSLSPVVNRSSVGNVELATISASNPEENEGSTRSTYVPLEKAYQHPSIWEEMKIVLSEPLYLCITLGNAAQTGSLVGVATFGSAFLLGK